MVLTLPGVSLYWQRATIMIATFYLEGRTIAVCSLLLQALFTTGFCELLLLCAGQVEEKRCLNIKFNTVAYFQVSFLPVKSG